MRHWTITTLAVLLMVSPAAAEWQLDDESDGAGVYLVASQIDDTDTIEVQVICDAARQGKLLFSVFTGVPTKDNKDVQFTLPVTVAFGSVSFDLDAEVVDNSDERILDISEADFSEVRAIAAGIRKGKAMTVSYRDDVWELPANNAAQTLAPVLEECP